MNAAALKNSALVTLTSRTRPEDWRTNSFGPETAGGGTVPSDTRETLRAQDGGSCRRLPPNRTGGGPSVTLSGCTIEFNEADGGAAGTGGSAGHGIGGGVYNRGAFSFDPATVISDNDASTSNDDIFP